MAKVDDSSSWADEFRAALGSDPRDSGCTVCRSRPVLRIHRVDPQKSSYVASGESKSIRPTWLLCERCEGLYQAGDDHSLATLMMEAHSGWDLDLDEDVKKLLLTFRKSDLGNQRLDR